MKIEGLIFLILGIILCVVGTIYTTDWALAGIWIGGFIMIIISAAIIFPRKEGVSIE